MNIFIDGSTGTVGLNIKQRLSPIPEINILDIPPEKRKDISTRLEYTQKADLTILCLPEIASKEFMSRINSFQRILDTSTAFRVNKEWTYGLPELTQEQKEIIGKAKKVANPGCYATGIICLLRPLICAGILPSNYPISIHATSGYSGGGKTLINKMESGEETPFKIYALNLQHKHLPEIMCYSGITQKPIFIPSVGNYRQGMIVSIPLHCDYLFQKTNRESILQIYKEYYASHNRIIVTENTSLESLTPISMNNSDNLEIQVIHNNKHIVLFAILDNLGMGAAGTAVQNIINMLKLTNIPQL